MQEPRAPKVAFLNLKIAPFPPPPPQKKTSPRSLDLDGLSGCSRNFCQIRFDASVLFQRSRHKDPN